MRLAAIRINTAPFAGDACRGRRRVVRTRTTENARGLFATPAANGDKDRRLRAQRWKSSHAREKDLGWSWAHWSAALGLLKQAAGHRGALTDSSTNTRRPVAEQGYSARR